MTKKINIIRENHPIFDELILSLSECLENSGYEISKFSIADKRTPAPSESWGDCNIVIDGRGCVPKDESKLNILIETEQHYNRTSYEMWTRILQIFIHRVPLYKNNVYFPIGYSKFFDTSLECLEEVRDFLFIGAAGAKTGREQFCKENGILHFPRTGIWGDKRDKLIIESKININLKRTLKHTSVYYVAPIHASLILCKGKVLMQEVCESGDVFYDKYLTYFTREKFMDVALPLLEDNEKRIKLGKTIQEELKNDHPFSKYFKLCLSDLL